MSHAGNIADDEGMQSLLILRPHNPNFDHLHACCNVKVLFVVYYVSSLLIPSVLIAEGV